MMNIDYPMQVDPKLFTINDESGNPLRVEIMTTISQKDDGDSVMDDDDIYAKELQRIKEEPTKRLMAKNERLKKQFKDLQTKKRDEDRAVEKLRETVETMENDLRNTKEELEAHKSREPSPVKQKYENHYKKYIERVEELEKIKDNIAKDTLEALTGIVGSVAGVNDLLKSGKRKDDDDDDEIINKVGKGHKNRKKYKPAVDAK
jgi:chromosome segregation ATPase